MRKAYFFQITNSKKYYYTLFANILLLVNFVLFSLSKYNLYKTNSCNSIFSCLILPNIILFFFLIRFYFLFAKRKLEFTNFHFALIATVGWLSLQQWWAAAVIFILGLIEYLVNKDLQCITNEQGITITSVPKRVYRWKDINNVLLKDGMFTIDQKNNHILQIDVSDEVIPFTEEAYNAFVQNQLIG